jgi:hypothetical protein
MAFGQSATLSSHPCGVAAGYDVKGLRPIKYGFFRNYSGVNFESDGIGRAMMSWLISPR